ncbi:MULTISPECIES: PASTA domain-containing protein [unclassified Oceanispirochaeta]|uniref:PASTA domain-containing protein n=1 Tax=unclassified Oceanispirochaeta TaxID=2635722 RepID=UPI000E09D8B6|nr:MULTISPECIES: PASTA domain-containing protein [unclassified Oceanispirochaeta]MBF9016231.1 PASTA domain-containing protein [Oceanispirochaeta sp. M2]NPD72693.1 PASTA domain-containing protein [Oceanispirochaeta sp. M1]RDG31842.1 PASTA domain-containing protein [Oceanispirochaeta sp. M1]
MISKIKSLIKPPVRDSFQGKTDLESRDEKNFFRMALGIILGTLLVLFFSFMITFFVSVRGAEQTLVPNVTGEYLIDGLINLQEKELYPRIQVRYTEDPLEKDHIISQDPKAGSVVRAGKRIKLTISKGAVVDKVGSYTGLNLSDVKTQLQTLFASYKPLMVIKEPVVFVFDDATAGTILEQEPIADTPLTGLTELIFVVSRGPVGKKYNIDDFTELRWMDAVNRLVRSNQPFVFTLSEDEPGNNSVVLKQVPASGKTVMAGTRINLTISTPKKLARDEGFGMIELTLPDYPVSVDLTVERTETAGRAETIMEMKHPGGRFSMPYREKIGTEITVKIYDEVVKKITVE